MQHAAQGKTAPLVSIIIPTRNRSDMLSMALDSVRAQTLANYEVIVVGNGQDPEQAEASRQAAIAQGAQYYELPEGNLPAARNLGIRMSKGAWIAFLDDDDLWLPNKLERQVEEAKTTNADMVVCNHVNLLPDGKEQPNGWTYPEGWAPLKALCHQKWGALPSAVLIAKDTLLTVGWFDENQQMGEDGELWRRVAWRHTIHRMDGVLLRYRVGHTRMSEDRRAANQFDVRHYAKMYFDTPKDLRWALPPITACVCRLAMRILLPRSLRHPRKWLVEVTRRRPDHDERVAHRG
jgi:glycosyltransferase involved in cell wall biosynthesis